MLWFAKTARPVRRPVRGQLPSMSDHLLRDIGLDPVPPRIPHPRLW
ncbi:protein of unknown function [Antarctobacter heliothermus]|uniref:YjiS-like domain-containing protein n=1 Tax=Antarctobacter heliothermus TaxID=74033 RepID=A0A239JNE7_9RHOB|nr:protein of unknown function [Antarctobacter heliothermus]